jgi:UMF1 family MFS transporter
MTARAASRRTSQISWALADWAREPFFSIVLSLVLPPFFVARIAQDPVAGTAWWGYSLTVAALALVLLAPLVGAIAYASERRKSWIALCTGIASLALLGLWFATAAPGWVLPVLALCAVAQVSIELMRVFTDRLMPEIASPAEIGRLSGLGVGLGFAASLIFLATLELLQRGEMTLRSGELERAATAGTGLWLAVFIIPLLIFGPGRSGTVSAARELAGRRWRDFFTGIVTPLRSDRQLARFLLARMAYWDGTMALFSFFTILASTALGWSTREMTTFGLLGLLSGATAGLLAGRVDARLGARNTVIVSLGGMILCTLALAAAARAATPGVQQPGFDTATDRVFLGMGVAASGFLGLIMSSSRSLLVRLAPVPRLGEYLGLYVMVGRASSFLAPLLVAVSTTLSGDQRTGVFGVSFVLLGLGVGLLARVKRC